MKPHSEANIRIFILLLLIIGSISCRKNTNKKEAEKMVIEWTGKEIIFPSEIPCTYFDYDTVCPDKGTQYKILFYTDSTGCTLCKLNLYKWNGIINEAEEKMSGKASFYFYFQPKDEKELKYLLKQEHFTNIVHIDRQNKLYETNHLPNNPNYQCFLLDKDNKVLLIGNPILNPKIWELFKQTVMGGMNVELTSCTTVEVEQHEIELQNAKVHKPSVVTFVLTNTGETPLVIKDITAACGCTVPEWDRKPIKPGERTEIKVKVTPDGEGYFRKTVTLFCNTKEGTIPLSVKSKVKG